LSGAYYDKSKAYKSIGPITPLEFYENHVKPIFNVEHKVCLVNDPRPSSMYDQTYTVDCLGNVVGGRPVLYNNQQVEKLLQLVVASLKAGEAVWFGCEVSKRFASKQGIEDLDRLIFGESAMTHAMLFTAVSLDANGDVTKLRVENSWSEDRGEKGYLVMTAEWFKEFGFEVVIDKSFVPPEILQVFDMDPIVLPAWDCFSKGGPA
ncbi:bleomycin hydrolase-like, partial [Rhagoletis pomonella]|uniref:bleomycin hydrolase-like n=1 Tax=Rhagoletis pomonella TaxID=28610 RepID=UPI0017874575